MPFTILRQDITHMEVDAIVNPANPELRPGGGCCGFIHRAAGPELANECARIGYCPTGEARITKGYDLPAKYVIHTPGPVYGTGNEEALLKSCYTNSLRLAAENGCESIAFPLISAGIYGYPVELALVHAREAIASWLMTEDDSDMQVYLCLFSNSVYAAGSKLFKDVKSYIDDNYEGIDRLYAERRARPMRNKPIKPEPSEIRRPSASRSRPVELEISYDDAPSMDYCEASFSCFDESISAPDINDFLSELDESFSEMLIRLIDERGLKDSDVYKRANKDRKLFNKIKLNKNYHPGKQTVLAFAVALKLNLETTKQLLERAGYALTHSSRGDLAVEYFITHNMYDIMEINQFLWELDEVLL